MRARIKSLHSPDLDDLHIHVPRDKDNFCILVEFTVGPETEPGEELFSIQVCTPLWLASFLKPGDSIFGRHFLIILTYDFNLILDKIKFLVEHFEEKNWTELTLKISRFAHWEFEDYIE